MPVIPGISRFRIPRGRRVDAALVCNQASVDPRLRRTADIVAALPGVRLRWLLGPEHGLCGVEQDMVGVGHSTDGPTGVPVVSLYGSAPSSLAPPKRVLEDVDVLIFDLQDIGSRYYTFFSTLVHCMRACAAAGARMVVLDRPNPLGGVAVEGNGVESGFESFVGIHDMPVRHGMTVGEMALMVNAEAGIGCDLRVVPMRGWQRGMDFSDTRLPWVAPSPNMSAPTTALVYPGMCLFEGTHLSEGRGTTRPFELFGAPFVDPFALCRRLESLKLPGVAFRPDFFKPQFHKFAGQVCGGAQAHVTDARTFRPYLSGVAVLAAVKRLWPNEFRWRTEPYEFVGDRPAIDLLTGTDKVRMWVDEGRPLREFRAFFDKGAAAFKKRRKQFLLYS
ncbi:MAG: DUF1343 domain-containing protein [Deltaproteobacteria bacterium]|nr:DUF1343 domain-containing protein [Deltaproteobacteria bacterium]